MIVINESDSDAERNHAPAPGGRVVAICRCCDRRSLPAQPNHEGEPDLWNMARGWSVAPLPADFQHDDGSLGSTFTCPACNARLRKGEPLPLRNGRHSRNVS